MTTGRAITLIMLAYCIGILVGWIIAWHYTHDPAFWDCYEVPVPMGSIR